MHNETDTAREEMEALSSLADWEIKSDLILKCLKRSFRDRGCTRPHSNGFSFLHGEVFKVY